MRLTYSFNSHDGVFHLNACVFLLGCDVFPLDCGDGPPHYDDVVLLGGDGLLLNDVFILHDDDVVLLNDVSLPNDDVFPLHYDVFLILLFLFRDDSTPF